MKDATQLDIYFNDTRALFLIPLYQRKYSWKKKHCQRLFSDLEKIHNQKLRSHFFGSIVSVKASEIENDILIIDGQQRLTTISLLILAAINAVKKGDMKCEEDDLVKDTYEKFIIAKYRKNVESKIKLCPIDEDKCAYYALVEGNEDQYDLYKQSGIMSNYLFLYDLITFAKNKLSFDNLIEAIGKLTVIDIRLDSGDNPQLIFESLNSCGKDLEEADKVRNYLLMSESKDVQEEHYKKYWSKIERNTDGEPTMFIRDYLTVKNNVISSIDELYFDFKQYHEDKNISRGELMEDMLKFSKYYKEAAKGDTENFKINKKLRQLASIGSNVCMPFYMAFFDYADTNGLNPNIVYEVLDVVENYWARRIICALPANAMAKTFALLHSDVMRIYREHSKKGKDVNVSYAEILKYTLLKKQGTGAFPDDGDIREMFPKRQIYKVHPSYRTFLFERMENLNSKEYNETIVQKLNGGKITIEHVMPQHLSTQWKKELGSEAEIIHQTYLHTFANLTLTGYNQEYGNRPYSEKWSGYTIKKRNKETKKEEECKINGFKDSHFRLSDYMKSHLQWTREELEERGLLLLNNFLELWPMITSDYKPLEVDKDLISLDEDDIEITGRKIIGYIYKGERHPVSTWKEMLVSICKELYAEKQPEMIYLAEKEVYLHSKQNHDTSMIAEGCHACTSSSTRSKIAMLRNIFSELNISPSSLELELLQADENMSKLEDEEE